MTGPYWTISNALSFMRIVLTFPLALLLLRRDPGDQTTLAGLVVALILTDLLDGQIARRLRQVTEIGKIVDPLADKIAVGTIAVILVIQERIPLWFVVMTLVRDIFILVGGIYIRNRKGILLQSHVVGKWAVTSLAAFLFVSMMDVSQASWWWTGLLYLSVAMMAISFAVYAQRFLRIISGR